jgi:quinol monooxygenase YgiN
MFVRQGSFEVVPGKLDALRETYNRDCVPIVRAAPGNVDAYLLEPADGAGPIIAVTAWQSEAHARAYDASGTAKEVVAKVKGFFAGPPVLRSYHLSRGAVAPST